MKKTVVLSLGMLLAAGQLLANDGWDNWRGPWGTGVAPEGSYPVSWEAGKNVVWRTEIPGIGGSTPIIAGDRIVLTTGAAEQNWMICYDMEGKELWRTSLGKERAGKHRKATGSNPSPLFDGEHLFAYYKSGDFACVDLDGEIVWQQNLQEEFGEDTLWWDLGTSPVLTQGHVLVACMHSGPSYLAAFDKASGKLVWKQDRNMDAPEEANQSYSTPVVTTHDGRETVVVLGADHVTGHDAKTGEQLWVVGGLNPTNNGYFRSISSPVASGDLIIAPYARGASLTAIKLGGTGDVRESHVVWESGDISSDVPTPASLDGKVYVLSDKGKLACLDAATGKILSEVEMEKNRAAYSASPIIAGGHLYLIREDGKTFVVSMGDEMKVVSSNPLNDELTVASPVFVNDKILIRTSKALYCIGE